MNSDDLVDQFRTEMQDLPSEEPLWADDEIYGFADSAQKLFVKLTGGLADASSALTKVPVLTTTDWVLLSPLILKIRDAYMLADGRQVCVVNYEDMPTLGIRFDGTTGDNPKFLVIGLEAHKARIYPFPTLAGTIQLLTDRLPKTITCDGGQNLEVDEQHRDGLMLWMKHRGYSKQDAETFDKSKAADFEVQFRAYCAMAKSEKDRAKHKTRITTYGGIPMQGIPTRGMRY